MGTINDKLTYLNGTKTAIKNQLIARGISVSDNDTFRSYAQKIADYEGIVTSDATATVDDIVLGKTAYGRGELLNGTFDKNGLLQEVELLENTIETDLPTSTTQKSTELDVTDSANYYSKLDLFGRTEQKQLDGRNLYDSTTKTDDKILGWTNSSVSNEENSIISEYIPLDNITDIWSNYLYAVFFYSGNKTYLGNSANLIKTTGHYYKHVTIPYALDNTIKYCRLVFRTGPNANTDMTAVTDLMVSKLEANLTPYEEYCGEQASPSTDYPQEIQNVEGNVTVKVYNKNLFDEIMENGTISASTGQNGSSSTIIRSKNYIKLKSRTISIVSKNTLANEISIGLRFYDANYNYISSISIGNYTKNITTSNVPENAKYMRFIATTTDTTIKFAVIDGNSNTYIEHHEQLIDFPLSANQKLFEGDYLADNGIHHVRYQKELTGTENWRNSIYNNIYAFFVNNDLLQPKAINIPHIKKCNKFIYSSTAWKNAPVPSLCENSGDPYLFIFNTDGSFGTNITEWKQYIKNLYDNNDPIIVEYELANEIVEPYTTAQQQAYNELQKLLLDHGTNYIWTETEGLNPNLQLTYKQNSLPISLQSKDVTINTNGTTTIEPDTGYDGLSDVDVTVSGILDTSDADATAGDIAKNKTAYVNGIKVTGTLELSVGGLDIYVQNTEPEEYDGIWIKSNSYEYQAIKEISDVSSTQVSTLNILVGAAYSTKFSDGDLTYKFDGVYITDSNNNILYNIEVYYGDGEDWVDITPTDPSLSFAGISVDFVNGTVTELEGSVPVNQLNCYSGRRRCNMSDNGTITAYYGDNNYDNIGSGSSQVMVEQPKVYYSLQNVVVSDGAIQSADYIVADTQIDNTFALHPAFISNGIEYEKIYVGAYEGTVVDNKLSSIGGGTFKPTTSKTRANFRTYASNRGSKWMQLTKQYEDLETLLMMIEYVSLNFQDAIAYGVANSNEAQLIGQTYSLDENGTGLKGADKTVSDCFTWRWRENPYGNVFKYNDGVNCNNNTWYIKDNNFQDDTSSGYTQLSETAGTTNGYIIKLAYVENAKWVFMPKVISSQSGLIRDYYYPCSSWAIMCSSGNWSGKAGDGGFTINTLYRSNDNYDVVGACLMALGQIVNQ